MRRGFLPLKRCVLAVAALACLGGSTPPALADLLASDSFNYPTAVDANNLDGRNGGSGWTNAWDAPFSGTAAYEVNLIYQAGDVRVLGGGTAVRLTNTSTNNQSLNRAFATLANDPDTGLSPTIYFSFLFRTDTAPNGDDFIHFMLNDNTVNTNSGGIGDVDASGTGGNTFGARIGNANGGGSSNFPRTYNAGETYLLVGRISDELTGEADSEGTYDHMTLWVNPTTFDEQNPGTDWTITDTDNTGTFTHVDNFVVRTYQMEPGDLYFMDELRIGTSFGDVVPEPASMSLLLLGAAAMLQRRRSK